jgi:alkylhydroperoxidase/carboxymuconolactone decarboxylase family protein YurZ
MRLGAEEARGHRAVCRRRVAALTNDVESAIPEREREREMWAVANDAALQVDREVEAAGAALDRGATDPSSAERTSNSRGSSQSVITSLP